LYFGCATLDGVGLGAQPIAGHGAAVIIFAVPGQRFFALHRHDQLVPDFVQLGAVVLEDRRRRTETLASLATKAEDCGDHYLINGQKIWTSYADKSDWIFCLVRTDNSGSKHEGISFVLFDMDQSGVTTRPIKLISGSSPFCETFFDNAKADKSNRVGEEGNGWTIAKYLLTHEREMISGFGAAPKKSVGQLAVEAFGTDASGRLANSVLRQNIAQYQLDTLVFGATMARVGDEAKAGQGLGAASSIFKYYGTELNKRRNELNMAVGGEFSLGWEGEAYHDGRVSRDWLRSKGNSIEGGTSEVQLNIISKRVLGLPDQ
jgi:acyl-CoA dehydrogenase